MRASAPARGGTDISLEEARGMREESEAAVHHRNRRDGSEKNRDSENRGEEQGIG